jgi:hypothetical protein
LSCRGESRCGLGYAPLANRESCRIVLSRCGVGSPWCCELAAGTEPEEACTGDVEGVKYSSESSGVCSGVENGVGMPCVCGGGVDSPWCCEPAAGSGGGTCTVGGGLSTSESESSDISGGVPGLSV